MVAKKLIENSHNRAENSMIYYELCLMKCKGRHRYKIHCQQQPYGTFLSLPRWLENQTKQIYINIKSAQYNLYNIQTRMQKEGMRSVVYFELRQSKF